MPYKKKLPDITTIFNEWLKVNKIVESYRKDSNYWRIILKNLCLGYNQRNKKYIYRYFNKFQKQNEENNKQGQCMVFFKSL